MKKEMLRIHNLNCKYSSPVKLADVSICLMTGETAGILGLINSGKNMLIDILCGKQEEFQGIFYLEGKRVANMEDIHKHVYKISASNYLIDSWTVAEYIYLLSEPSFFGIYQRKKLVSKANSLFKQLELDVDADKKLKHLTEFEKRLADLAKAYSLETKILIIEDDFEGCSAQEIMRFKDTLNRVINGRMTAIVNSYSEQVLKILSDKYVIFKNGYIVKKCEKDYIRDKAHMEKFLLGTKITTMKKDLESYKNEYYSTRDIMYSVRNMVLKKGNFQFDFYKGEVVFIIDLDAKEKKHIFDMFSGRYIDKTLDIYLEQRLCNFNDITDFVRNKIVSVANLGNRDELMLQMSAGDNLLLPSLHKIPSLRYFLNQSRITSFLENEVKKDIIHIRHPVQDMSTSDCFVLLLERWYIYKPKVLILFEPFMHCDIFGISLVKSYIRKFTGFGTTVIILKSSPEYTEDISDRIIYME
ncbi:MAG: ATP-binding cassette domain-containing protein [Bacillota bacterium]